MTVRSRRLLAVCALVLASPPARSADVSWDGGGDGASWSDADNWSGDVVPGADDHALIAFGSVRLTGAASALRLTLSGSATLDLDGSTLTLGAGPTLVGSGAVLALSTASSALLIGGPTRIEGRLDWSEGEVYADTYYLPPGDTVLTVAPGGVLRWHGAGDKRLSATLVNEGTLRWEAGRPFYMQGYATSNAGVFEIALAADAAYLGGGTNSIGPWVFTNTGTVRKTGPGTATIQSIDLQTVGGLVDVQEGALVHEFYSRWDDATVAVSAGATLRLTVNASYPQVVAGTLSGTVDGTFVASGTFGSSTTIWADPVRGGALDLAGNGLLLNGATLGGTNGSVVHPAPVNRGVLRIGGGPDNVLNIVDAAFHNEGTLRWEALPLLVRAGTTFRNAGLFEIDPDADVILLGGESGGVMTRLLNEGTLRKTGPARVEVRADVTSGGRLAVVEGTFAVANVGHLNAFVNETGGTLSGSGLLDLSALDADHLVNDGATAPGPGDDGAGVGTLAIGGPLPLGGALFFDLAGAAPGTFDRLLVSGGVRDLAASIVTARPSGGFVAAIGQTFDVIEGDVSGALVGVVSTMPGVDFEASYPGAGVRLTAVAGGPGAPIFLTPDPLVSGGVRDGIIVGASLTPGATVALVCVDCVDPVALGRIPGEVTGAGPERLDVRFDLSDVAAYGAYALVVVAAGDSLRTEVVVEPYLAVPLVLQAGVPAIPILPAPGARSTAVNAYLATNHREPTFFLMQFERPAPQVRYAPYGILLAPEETGPPLTFLLAVAPSLLTPQTVMFGTGIDPTDVRFPDEAPPVPDDPRLPLGVTLAPRVVATGALSPAQLAEVIARVVVAVADSAGIVIPPDSARAAARRTVDAYLNGPSGGREASRRFLGAISLPHLTGGVVGQLGSVGQGIDNQALIDQFGRTSTYVTQMLEGSGGMGGGACPAPGTATDAWRAALQRRIDAERARPNANTLLIEQLEAELSGPAPLWGAGGCGQTDTATPLQVRAAWDPNDKVAGVTRGCELVGEGAAATCGRHLIPLAEAGEAVTYTIRFENLAAATAPAETVTVTDVLDDAFDPSTLEWVSTTADSLFSYAVSGQTVTFTFAGIDLPPNQTPPEGEGALTFRVRPRAGLPDGTELRNSAAIVFDFNPPILTPEVVHVIRATADLAVSVVVDSAGEVGQTLPYAVTVANAGGADPAQAATLALPVPAGATLLGVASTVGTCGEAGGVVTCGFGDLAPGAGAAVTLVLRPDQPGALTLTATVATATQDARWFDDAVAVQTLVAPETGAEEEGGAPAYVLEANAPNPFGTTTTIRYGLRQAGRTTLVVYDLLGRLVQRVVDADLPAGRYEARVDGGRLASGTYVYQLRSGDFVEARRMLVVR